MALEHVHLYRMHIFRVAYKIFRALFQNVCIIVLQHRSKGTAFENNI